MTRMLAIIVAALVTMWFPSEAARLDDHRPAAGIEQAASPHDTALQNRFAGIALR